MDEASCLNADLERAAPAAARCLSPLGRSAVFPRGIPFQADAAASTEINATIGQLTDGAGQPLPLPAVDTAFSGLDRRRSLLYASVEGPLPLREAWLHRQRKLAGEPGVSTSLPFVTHGLTHGLSLLAALFADPDTEIVVPDPSWGNYRLVFELHAGARQRTYPFFDSEGGFNVAGLAAALEQVRGKCIVLLNFPGNPTGYTPTPQEAQALVDVLTAHRGPAVVICDDAYQGWVYEPGLMRHSVFWDLAERHDPDRLFPVKVDGATKELVFFASRVAFLTHTATEAGEAALLSKLKCVVRGTVGSASGPALAAVERALQDPLTESAFEERRRMMAGRYRALKSSLLALDHPACRPLPFNSAFFALLELSPEISVDEVRERLIAEHSVGTVAFPKHHALRLAYCSIREEQLPELVRRLGAVLNSS